jgi:hypothetical protein
MSHTTHHCVSRPEPCHMCRKLNDIEAAMEMKSWNYVDDLIPILAKYCLKNNFIRKGESVHDLTPEECCIIKRNYSGDEKELELDFQGGEMFLWNDEGKNDEGKNDEGKNDEGKNDEGKEGFIRIYIAGCNPKWTFIRRADGMIRVDEA